MFFNDPLLADLGFHSISNHDEHLHVCFRDKAANRRKCEGTPGDPNSGFNRDPNICHFGQEPPAGASRPGAGRPAVVPPAENRNGNELRPVTF